MTLGLELRRALGAVGVGAVYGEAMDGLGAVPAPSLQAAGVLALAHHRVLGQFAATSTRTTEGTRLSVSRPAPPPPGAAPSAAGMPTVVRLDDPGQFDGALERFVRALYAPAGGDAVLDVALDPATPLVPGGHWWDGGGPEQWVEVPDPVRQAVHAANRPVLLAGPGVLHHGAVPGLHALATVLDTGVLNTWGAKGVFDWRDPHHWATVGLQARDLELGGMAGADLVLTSGLDPDETPRDLGSHAPVLDVPPAALDRLASTMAPRRRLGVVEGSVEPPTLRQRLSAATSRGWARSLPPLAPTQATRTYAQLSAGRGLVAADPGTAGYWVARTFPTTVAGEALVPGDAGSHGFAVACAMVARRHNPGRAVVAVLDDPIDRTSAQLLETASTLGLGMVVEVWDPEGVKLDAPAHAERLRHALRSCGAAPLTLHLGTFAGQMEEMVAAAGAVTAWSAWTGGDTGAGPR